MRITPAPPLRPRRTTPQRVVLTVDSDLGATILRMIASHSLSAFTPASGRPVPTQPVRGVAPAAPTIGQDAQAGGSVRSLEAVPPQPGRPVPRGSLLDLRV